jgi:hypothetical protein
MTLAPIPTDPPTEPEPITEGISKKLIGNCSDALMILIRILSLAYVSKTSRYEFDIA